MEVTMNVTEEMLDAAMKKAVEAGLLPRHACREDMSVNQELIRYILQAALDTVAVSNTTAVRKLAVPTDRYAVQRRFADVRERYWYPGYAQS
jgi:hypothetical protein